MCNLETSMNYAPGKIANFTATKGLPDRQHCPEENLYVGGANDYNPGAKMPFVSLMPITAQNRVSRNYQSASPMGGVQYSFAGISPAGSYKHNSLEAATQYSSNHAHESAAAHAQHKH